MWGGVCVCRCGFESRTMINFDEASKLYRTSSGFCFQFWEVDEISSSCQTTRQWFEVEFGAALEVTVIWKFACNLIWSCAWTSNLKNWHKNKQISTKNKDSITRKNDHGPCLHVLYLTIQIVCIIVLKPPNNNWPFNPEKKTLHKWALPPGCWTGGGRGTGKNLVTTRAAYRYCQISFH